METKQQNTVLNGFYMPNDRRWLIKTPNFEAEICEYNDELTGFDPRLKELDPSVFYYGSNAYYILGRYSIEKGYTIRERK